MNSFVDELQARGLIYQKSPEIEQAFEKGTTIYLGYDPTGPDLHIGHLLGITVLKRALEHGQKIIVLVGGGTSMIGDPGGKDAERPILPKEQIEANKEKMKEQFSHFFTFDNDKVTMVDNAEWLENVKLIEFLREAGKFISINTMLDKDSVKARIDREEGISYAEFSYQLLQAYDFMELYKRHNCEVQMGGSDQWGNIIQGTQLIRKRLGKPAYALSYPLIVNPKTGKKFGKTESGEGIWLNPEKTHPFAFYQFLLNSDDDIAPLLMKFFSFKSVEEIEKLIEQWNSAKHERLLQKELAYEVTAMAHGQEAADQARQVAGILFDKKAEKLTEENMDFLKTALPYGKLEQSEEFDLAKSALTSGLVSSNSEAKRLIEQKGLSHEEIGSRYILLKKGKREFGVVEKISV
jgi:tyrosyl-tRNA synthetase